MVDFNLDNEIAKIKELKDIHKGDKCFIVGNGPSLNKMNLDWMAGEYSFALNRIGLIYEHTIWRPTYFVQVNEISKFNPPHMFEEQIQIHHDMGIPVIINSDFGENSCPRHQKYRDMDNRYFMRCWGGRDAPFSEKHWSSDISKTATKPGSCLMALIQIACYMGFNKIFLIGCDLGYKDTKGVDVNHFTQDYNYMDTEAHIHNTIMLSSHQLAKKMTAPQGVEILNATEGGFLEIYPRISFAEATYTSGRFLPQQLLAKEGDDLVGAEIGVAEARTSLVLLNECKNIKHLTVIDPWADYTDCNGSFGKDLQDRRHRTSKHRLTNFIEDQSRYEMVREYSQNASERFEDESLDFVYIDGNHSYEFV
ncbi:DUF115 domain-containing protein, partial [Candidatus Pacearchaeota archaeon]|nr:DUF115 domain-containing protein [Candidatus Pacearchaeota archaeon]